MARITRAQIDAVAARVRTERAGLVSCMTPEQLAQHDAAEATYDIFELAGAERAAEAEKLILDEAERMTLASLGLAGIRYLTNLTEADYTPFDINGVGIEHQEAP